MKNVLCNIIIVSIIVLVGCNNTTYYEQKHFSNEQWIEDMDF